MTNFAEIILPVREKVFIIFGRGGHLGHVTWIINIHIDSPFLKMLYIKFSFDWPSGFRGESP